MPSRTRHLQLNLVDVHDTCVRKRKTHQRFDIKPAIRRGAIHKIDGVLLGIRFVINMMALDDVPDIPRETRRACRRERNPRASHTGTTGALLAKCGDGTTALELGKKPEQLDLPRKLRVKKTIMST